MEGFVLDRSKDSLFYVIDSKVKDIGINVDRWLEMVVGVCGNYFVVVFIFLVK